MTSDSARNNALLAAQLASLPVDSDGNYIPTPAEPGVARIDYATDNTGLQTGDIGQFGYTDDLSPVIGGYQAEATGDLVIRIVCNAEFIGTALIGPDGHWSFTPPTPLEPNHEYIFTTIIQDSATDALLVSLPYRFYTTDVNGDLQPDVTLDEVVDMARGADGATGLLHHGDVTNDARPTLVGHANAGARVNIYDNGELIGSVIATSKGTWSYNPANLSDGVHYLSASVYTAAGESHRSPSFGITVDTHAETPVITGVYDDVGTHQGPVALGGATDDGQPLVSGTAEAGSTVTVTAYSAALHQTYTLGSAVADVYGHWSYQLGGSQDITSGPGDWTFTAQAVDVAGNLSNVSSGYLVEVVTSNADAGAAPAITGITDDVGLHTGNIADGGKTDDRQPEVHGTGEPYSTVVLKMYGPGTGKTYTIATLDVGADGHWSYQFTGKQAMQNGNGGHNIFTATSVAADGHTVTSDSYTVTLVGSGQDVDRPDIPTIDKYHDNAGDSAGDFKSGSTTDDTTPTLYGHADAKSVVKIYDGSTLLGSTTADNAGDWSFTPSERSEGKHTFFATATDAAGQTSDNSAGFLVTIDVPDTTPPDAPVITQVYDDVGTQKGPVANHGKTDDSQPLISGTAEKNSVVTINAHSPAGTDYTLGSVVTDGSGHWSYQLHGTQSITGTRGDWTFTARAADAAGNASGWSADYTVESVGANQDDTSVPGTPTITSAYDNVGDAKGDIKSGATTDDTTPELRGHADASSIVKVYEGSTLLGSTTAKADGSWSFTPAARSEGKHTFFVTATNAAGHTSGHSGNFVVTIDVPDTDTTPPGAPVITQVYDDVGTQKGPVANHGKTDDSQPLISGTAEKNSVVTIKVHSAAGKDSTLGSVVTDNAGHWSYQLHGGQSITSSKGDWTFTAQAADAAGNKSGWSAGYTVESVGTNQDDTSVPGTPTIVNYHDDVGAVKSDFTSGTTTDDSTPELKGHADASSIVKVYEGSTLLGSTTAHSDGSWSFTPSARSDGKHTFFATATNAAGHTSGHSGNFVVTVDTTPPGPPHVSGIETCEHLSLPNAYEFGETYTLPSGLIMTHGGGPLYFFNDGYSPVAGQIGQIEDGGLLSLTCKWAKFELPGVADKVSMDTIYMDKFPITFYDADGNEINCSKSSVQPYFTHTTYTAPAGHEIASFYIDSSPTLHASFIDNIEWSSASPQLAATHSALLSPTTEESPDTLLLSQIMTQDNQPAAHADLTNNHQDTLHLTLNDILSEAHPNLFVQDGHQQLAVTGDQGDVVELKVDDLAHNTWLDTGAVTAGGIQYEVYQHASSDVELLVQHGLELHQVA